MESIPGIGAEKPLVSFEESHEAAKRLLKAHHQELLDMMTPGKVCGLSSDEMQEYRYGKSTIPFFLSKIPEQVRTRFMGHGIVRRDDVGNLAALLNSLQNHTMKGESASLIGSGYHDAVTNGEYLVLSRIDKPLAVFAPDRKQFEGPLRNEIGWVADIGACVISTRFYPLVEDLRARFPDAPIIRANELVDYINGQASVAAKG